MNAPASPRRFADGFRNFVANLLSGVDKLSADGYDLPILSQQEIEAAYRTGWFRKIVNIPPDDMTREWRYWQADKNQIELIEEEERRLDVRRKARSLLRWGRLYGGAVMTIGTGDANPESPLVPERVGKGGVQFLHVLHRYELTDNVEIEADPLSPFYGQPKMYQLKRADGQAVSIHPSRVIRFVGLELPNSALTPADIRSGGWGDSMWTVVERAVKNADLSAAGIAAMVHEAKVDVVRVDGFMRQIATTEYETLMKQRFALANQLKSIANVFIVDKNDEYESKQLRFAGLDDVLKLFLSIMAGVADIPATRMLGKSPDGLNATGESDLRNYYDALASYQETDLRPVMAPLDELIIRSALGSRPPEIHYAWAPLWQPTAAEVSEINKRNAESDQILADSGLIPNTALSAGVRNRLIEQSVYPGIEAAFAEADAAGEVAPIEEEPSAEELAAEAAKGQAAKRPGARPALRVVGGDGLIRVITDATPRTLYVSRRLQNAGDLVEWAKSQGFKSTVPVSEMHVTLAFSREPVDWMKVGEDWSSEPGGRLIVEAGGPRLVEPLGPNGAVVLLFSSWRLSGRHAEIRRAGASWDWPEYQPHVTITFEAGGVKLEDVEPYRGRLIFGPEIFDELDDDWRAGVAEAPTSG